VVEPGISAHYAFDQLRLDHKIPIGRASLRRSVPLVSCDRVLHRESERHAV
jgi:hypothetical protein